MENFNFSKTEITSALFNRFVVIIGDSNQRNIYKDLILLLQTGRYLTKSELRSKGETTFLNDKLIEGGCLGIMSNGTNYREVRQYKTNVHLVRFYFVTRCYNKYMESILEDLQHSPIPDIVVINSCLWDITRYGRESIPDYKENLKILFRRFTRCLPPSCLVIWNTTLPISSSAKSGFLVPEVAFKASSLRLDILEANYYAQKVATKYGFDVLDLHFYLRHQLYLRANDGIHWDMMAHRTISNLILTHIFEAWEIPVLGKQITLGSYGSTNARNGYYQQLSKDREQELLKRQAVVTCAKDRHDPQPSQGSTETKQQPLVLDIAQGSTETRQQQPLVLDTSQGSTENKQQQPLVLDTSQGSTENKQQPLLLDIVQKRTETRQLQPLRQGPFHPHPVQLQPVPLQSLQPQPLQYIDLTSDTSMFSNSFGFGADNMAFQNMEGFDPYVWQPYQQSFFMGSEPGHSRTRYQPYTHSRNYPSTSNINHF